MADAIYVDKDAQPAALVGRVLNKVCRAFAVGSGLTLIADVADVPDQHRRPQPVQQAHPRRL
jgi:hypothetical protein